MKSISDHLHALSSQPASREELERALSLIDLTSLEGTDNEATIQTLCQKAVEYGTAAVCVYPSLVKYARKHLHGTPVRIASVAGAFPSGQAPLGLRLQEAEFAISEGADEIDMVISRGKFLEGDFTAIEEEIVAFRKTCKGILLKVILETGELETEKNIRKASELAIESGADFIKTSTGKIPVNATLEAVCTMLLAIKVSGKKIGIKPSGGISGEETAVQYMRLTESILGNEWLDPKLFRIGASRLAQRIFQRLGSQ